jgi:two-component system OmpR family response regulator
MPRMLLIDDDAQLGPPLAAYFQRHGLQLEQARGPAQGLAGWTGRVSTPPSWT